MNPVRFLDRFADKVVWVAGPGGAAMQATPAAGGGKANTHGPVARIPFPNPRNHAEEIANALAEHEAART